MQHRPEIWQQREGQRHIIQLNTFLKPLNAWHVQQLKNAIAGNWEKMAFIERQKPSRGGRWKGNQGAPRVAWSLRFARGSAVDPDHVTAILLNSAPFTQQIRWSV